VETLAEFSSNLISVDVVENKFKFILFNGEIEQNNLLKNK